MCVFVVLVVSMTVAPTQKALSQDPITEIIKAAVIKVIKAVDLRIQRLQNETIWLQNIQRVAENTMSEAKLKEITGWVEKQRSLYRDYYDELWKVKSAISYYYKVKEITEKQIMLVKEYKRAWELFKRDSNFSSAEIKYMGQVYSGILSESVKSLDQIFIVVSSFETQIGDAKRLEIINTAHDQIATIYNDLKLFNQQNVVVSLQRSKSKNAVHVVRELYGIK